MNDENWIQRSALHAVSASAGTLAKSLRVAAASAVDFERAMRQMGQALVSGPTPAPIAAAVPVPDWEDWWIPGGTRSEKNPKGPTFLLQPTPVRPIRRG